MSMAEALATVGHTAPPGVWIERDGLDFIDWTTLKKRVRDLLRRSKNPVRCLARVREKMLGFLRFNSGNLGDDLVLKKGDRAPVGEVMMPASMPVLQNSENFESEKGKEKFGSQEGDRDHVVATVNSTIDCGDFNFNLGDVGTNSTEKNVNSSSLGGEFGSMISSVPACPHHLGHWRNMYCVQQDGLHQLGWKKGITADRIFEITVVKFMFQGKKVMVKEKDFGVNYQNSVKHHDFQCGLLSQFCLSCGLLIHSSGECKSRGEHDAPGQCEALSKSGEISEEGMVIVSYDNYLAGNMRKQNVFHPKSLCGNAPNPIISRSADQAGTAEQARHTQ